MIGKNQQMRRKNRQETAQISGLCNQGLMIATFQHHTWDAGVDTPPVAFATRRNVTPYFLERVASPMRNPFVFFLYSNNLSNRRGPADWRSCQELTLKRRPVTGLVRAAVKEKNQGSIRCEQRNSGGHWPYLAVLRPAAKRWTNRRSSAALRASAPRSYCRATRLSVLRLEPLVMCSTANKTQQNVTDPAPWGAELTNLKTFITGSGIASEPGDLRCQTPMSKDT
jgi:hypothetical protein